MLNMMVAVGLFPVTGQPLPLISKGGTSTLINCAYIGMMLSVSRYVASKEEQRLQEEMQANEEKLQVAAQALIQQAREIVNNENNDSANICEMSAETLESAVKSRPTEDNEV
jgi:cell division protein FtsW